MPCIAWAMRHATWRIAATTTTRARWAARARAHRRGTRPPRVRPAWTARTRTGKASRTRTADEQRRALSRSELTTPLAVLRLPAMMSAQDPAVEAARYAL